MKWLKTILAFCLMIAGVSLSGQTKMHVFTKTVTRNFDFKTGDVLIVNAIHANVVMSGWDNDSVSVVLKLKTKNEDYKKAKKDILNWSYIVNREGYEIVLKNYLKKENSFSNSIYTAEYEIKVPEKCFAHISNISGNITLKNMNGALRTNVRYGNIDINNFKGVLQGNVEVGDFTCIGSNLEMTLSTKHTEIYLEKVFGMVNIKGEYGSVRIVESQQFKSLNLEFNRADIYLVKKSLTEYGLDLSSWYGKINVDKPKYIKEPNKYSLEENEEYNKIIYKTSASSPLIKISSKYGNIFLN